MSPAPPRPFHTAAEGPLLGEVTVPGDKSISHRALLFAALAVGESRIDGLLEGEDVLATAAALRQMGAHIERQADGVWTVGGVGVGGLLQPERQLDMGNSGTSTRLLMGLVATHPITATFVGDASLSRRPMARVAEPLSRMGADITSRPGETLPLSVRGLCPAVPIAYTLPVASAQVKSAILLAGLNTPGITTVIEPVETRDHTERLLRAFGAEVTIEPIGESGNRISVRGEPELRPQHLAVPGDPSSAAFWTVAALIVPGSHLRIAGVGQNPTRSGLFTVLEAMGGTVALTDARLIGGEPVGDLDVYASPLVAVTVPPDLVPSMVDEFPILFAAAAFAEGRSVFRGLEELRVKESDRIATMAAALRQAGVEVEELPDGLAIQGTGGEPLPGGGCVETRLDHRVAMSMAVAGLHAREPIRIDDAAPIATSYPDFLPTLARLGGRVTWVHA